MKYREKIWVTDSLLGMAVKVLNSYGLRIGLLLYQDSNSLGRTLKIRSFQWHSNAKAASLVAFYF